MPKYGAERFKVLFGSFSFKKRNARPARAHREQETNMEHAKSGGQHPYFFPKALPETAPRSGAGAEEGFPAIYAKLVLTFTGKRGYNTKRKRKKAAGHGVLARPMAL